MNIEVELSNDTIIKLALEAHKRDITLNELCCEILEEYLKKVKIRRANELFSNMCDHCKIFEGEDYLEYDDPEELNKLYNSYKNFGLKIANGSDHSSESADGTIGLSCKNVIDSIKNILGE